MLKFKYTKESDIPEAHKALYVKKGDVWQLDADGAEDADRFNEFRDTNKSLMALLGVKSPSEALEKLKKLKDVDPDKYNELITKAETEEQERLKKEKGLEAAHEANMKKVQGEHQKALDAARIQNESLTNRLAVELIDNQVATVATKKGLVPTAVDDAKLLARGTFKIKDGALIAERDGVPVLGSDGKPITVEQWMTDREQDRSHWFAKNSGGGSGGSGGGGGAMDSDNPYKATKDHPKGNLYKQSILERSDAPRAAALKAAAGVK